MPTTNGTAVAALVTGVLSPLAVPLSFLIVPLLLPFGALTLGIVALRQINRTGQQGRGMALTGSIVGGAMTALLVVPAVVYIVYRLIG